MSLDLLSSLPRLDFQLSGVGRMSDGADAKPTAGAIARHKEPRERLKEIPGRLDAALIQNLGALTKAAVEAGIPAVIVAPIENKREP
jgi:hypothetical protein